MPQRSAGILMYRGTGDRLEVLLVHPGGPFWARKDAGAWTIPKGLVDDGEDIKATARREFAEETGYSPPGELRHLGDFRQPGGKIVVAFALEGDFDPAKLTSNLFSMEWPPRSGRIAQFPEVDQAGWFRLPEAREKLLRGQVSILDALVAMLK